MKDHKKKIFKFVGDPSDYDMWTIRPFLNQTYSVEDIAYMRGGGESAKGTYDFYKNYCETGQDWKLLETPNEKEQPNKLTQEQFETLLEELMDWFNFKKVADVMEFLKWKWAPEEGDKSFIIPTEPEIRKKVRDNFRSYYKNYLEQKDKEYSCSTGGFYYNILGDEIILKFVLESWNSFTDE